MTVNHIPKCALISERRFQARLRKRYILGFIVGILPWLVLCVGLAVVAYIRLHPAPQLLS